MRTKRQLEIASLLLAAFVLLDGLRFAQASKSSAGTTRANASTTPKQKGAAARLSGIVASAASRIFVGPTSPTIGRSSPAFTVLQVTRSRGYETASLRLRRLNWSGFYRTPTGRAFKPKTTMPHAGLIA